MTAILAGIIGLLAGALFVLETWHRKQAGWLDNWEREADHWRDKYIAGLENGIRNRDQKIWELEQRTTATLEVVHEGKPSMTRDERRSA